jgi:hypothetical protein
MRPASATPGRRGPWSIRGGVPVIASTFEQDVITARGNGGNGHVMEQPLQKGPSVSANSSLAIRASTRWSPASLTDSSQPGWRSATPDRQPRTDPTTRQKGAAYVPLARILRLPHLDE